MLFVQSYKTTFYYEDMKFLRRAVVSMESAFVYLEKVKLCVRAFYFTYI